MEKANLFKTMILAIIALLLSNNILAQSEIEFEVRKEGNKLIWVCKNNSYYTKEVTFTIKEPNGLRGYNKPVTKLVSSGAEMDFLTVTHNGRYGYAGTSWKFIDKPTKEENEEQEELKAEFYTTDLAKLDKGIFVFDKAGCPRCKRSIAYLIDNNYDFKIIRTEKGNEANKKMWELLKANGFDASINMPVFLVNGKLTADHKDLMGFVKGLPKRKE